MSREVSRGPALAQGRGIRTEPLQLVAQLLAFGPGVARHGPHPLRRRRCGPKPVAGIASADLGSRGDRARSSDRPPRRRLVGPGGRVRQRTDPRLGLPVGRSSRARAARRTRGLWADLLASYEVPGTQLPEGRVPRRTAGSSTTIGSSGPSRCGTGSLTRSSSSGGHIGYAVGRAPVGAGSPRAALAPRPGPWPPPRHRPRPRDVRGRQRRLRSHDRGERRGARGRSRNEPPVLGAGRPRDCRSRRRGWRSSRSCTRSSPAQLRAPEPHEPPHLTIRDGLAVVRRGIAGEPRWFALAVLGAASTAS